MFRFTIKNIWAHKTRLALSMLSIFLGVAFLSGTLIFTSTIRASFNDLFTSVYKKTDAVVESRNESNRVLGNNEKVTYIPREILDEVKTVPGVKGVQGEIGIANLTVIGKDGKRIFPVQGPPTFAYAMPTSAELTPWLLVGKNDANLTPQQTVQKTLADNEVIVDLATANAKNLTIGKSVKIVTDQDVRSFKIVGYMRFGTADGFGGTAAFFFNNKQASEISQQKDTYYAISIAAEDGISQEEIASRVRVSLAESHPKEYRVITGERLIKKSQDEVGTFFDFFTIFLLVFALISFLVALIIIVNSFAIIMTQRKREYALLRAIGATGGQIRRSVFGESIIVGLVASALGVGGGVGLTIGIKALLNAFDFGLPAGKLVIPATAVIIGMVVGTLSTFGSAFFPAWVASRVPPVAALSEAAFEKNRRMKFRIVTAVIVGIIAVATVAYGYQMNTTDATEKLKIIGTGFTIFLGFIVIALPLFVRPFTAVLGSRPAGIFFILFGGRRAFGITGEIARRNNYRNPRRSARTSLALMVGVFLVVFITVFTSSATSSFSSYLKDNFAADIVVGDLGSITGSLSETRCNQIDQQAFVEASSCLNSKNIFFGKGVDTKDSRVAGKTRIVYGINTEKTSTLFPIKHAGSIDELGSAGISLNKKASLVPPSVERTTTDLGENGVAISKDVAEKQNLKIGDKVTMFGDAGKLVFTVRGITEEGILGPGGQMVLIDISALRQLEKVDAAPASVVVLKSGVKTDKAVASFEKIFKDTGIEVNDLKTVRDQQIKSVNNVLSFFYGLLGLAIIIAAIGILNTMSLSILERRRELGLMRAVGTTKAQVRGFVRFESIILAVLGTSVGMVFGIGCGYIFIKSLDGEGFTSFSVNPVSMIAILFISALIGFIAGAWPAWRATKVDVLKAITVE